jgi:hypothetical protein
MVCVRSKLRPSAVAPDHNVRGYRSWHVPRNEREFLQSPQRALWRTARELKMDEYRAIPVWRLVTRSSLPPNTKLHQLLWAGTIKDETDTSVDPPVTTFMKLNPRLCVQGQHMDHNQFRSFADTMRFSFVKVMAAVRAAYGNVTPSKLHDFQFDIRNFFQSTRVEGRSDVPTLYTHQAPGFVEYGPDGEEMVYQVLVAMQGRIDAMRLSNQNLRNLLIETGVIRRLLHEPNAFEYHYGPTAGTDSTLTDILKSCHAAGATLPNTPPVGWAVFGLHVDDGIGVASSEEVAKFIAALVEGTSCVSPAPTGYTVVMHRWRKLVGFDAKITDHGTYTTVSLSSTGTIESLAAEHLAGVGVYAPKHVVPSNISELAPGVVPNVGSVDYDAFLTMQEKCASLNGTFIWLQQVYSQLTQPSNALSACAASFSHDHYKVARHMLMHLIAHPDPLTFGGPGCNSLESTGAPLPSVGSPCSHTPCECGLYAMVDSNLATPRTVSPLRPGTKSITGITVMLALACLHGLAQRQHLSAPDIHTGEMVAAGTATQQLLTFRGLLQEFHIPQLAPSPLYIDSLSSVFAANDEASVKKSVWMIRRAVVVQEAVVLKEISAIKISDAENLADVMTKYIKFSKWRRIIDILLNISSPAPPLCLSHLRDLHE